MRSAHEKRRHRRVPSRFPVRFRDTFAAPPQYMNVSSRDLSLGGVRFLSDSFVARDANIIIELHLDKGTRPVRAISRVAWARSHPSGYRFEVGSEFIEITPTEKRALDAFLNPPEVA